MPNGLWRISEDSQKQRRKYLNNYRVRQRCKVALLESASAVCVCCPSPINNKPKNRKNRLPAFFSLCGKSGEPTSDSFTIQNFAALKPLVWLKMRITIRSSTRELIETETFEEDLTRNPLARRMRGNLRTTSVLMVYVAFRDSWSTASADLSI